MLYNTTLFRFELYTILNFFIILFIFFCNYLKVKVQVINDVISELEDVNLYPSGIKNFY